MNAIDTLNRASRAKEVLENEEFISAFDAIKLEITEKWQTSPARDQEGREKLYLMLAMLNKVQDCLISTLETGRLAQEELRHQQTLADRAKEMLNWTP